MTILSVPEPVESPPQNLTSPAGYYDSENPPFVAAENYYGEQQATPTPVALSTSAQVVTSAPVTGQSGTIAPPSGQSNDAMLFRKRLLIGVGTFFAVGFFFVNRFFFIP